ncbi:tail fiber domain-containing protein [Salmonella enterica subsp. enterica serovar Kentucky]|nr:tail fiber domain-containing protein [Salmonella enterica subsp. enterica serovar Kentucky]
MALYRTGTAAMDDQGVITGTGTKWREPLSLIRTGATIVFLTSPLKLAVISDIVSDTEMKAIQTDGEPVENGNYVILLNDSLTVDGMAQDVAETLRYYQSKETVIEETIEFFKNFDLKTLQDLVNQIKDAEKNTAADRAATEQLKNDTQTIKDAAVNETNQIKADTDAIKNQTQQIKDSAVTEITGIKNEALYARDEAENAQFAAEQSKVGADNAKAGAETARDEARQWAQQVQPENLLHKDQNLNDLANKDLAREALKVEAVNSVKDQYAGAYNSFRNPAWTYELRIANNGEWRVARNDNNSTSALSIGAGGTGATSDVGARKNLNTPVGGKAIIIPNNSNILGFMSTYAESGYYSSGELVTYQPPEASGWWMYELHVHGKNSNGHVEYGNIVATAMNGNKWGIICNAGGWGAWYRIARSDKQLMLLDPNAASALGDYSITIGDHDSGLKWDRDGHISAFSDSARIFAWTPSGINTYRVISSYVDDNARGMYVNGVRRGDQNALIAGQVEGGSFDYWRSRASGLLVEHTGFDSAVAIFKSVYRGEDWIAGMDVAPWTSGGAETHLYVKGAEFIFDSAGNGRASNWVSSSDIRLKAHLKEIETASDKIDYLTGYTYYKRNNLIEDENSVYSIEAGLIAQDVERVLPEAVHSLNNDGQLDPKGEAIKGINYNGVVALLVNAFKEQKEKIEKQQEEIKELKNEIAEMKAAIAEMQAMFVQIAK